MTGVDVPRGRAAATVVAAGDGGVCPRRASCGATDWRCAACCGVADGWRGAISGVEGFGGVSKRGATSGGGVAAERASDCEDGGVAARVIVVAAVVVVGAVAVGAVAVGAGVGAGAGVAGVPAARGSRAGTARGAVGGVEDGVIQNSSAVNPPKPSTIAKMP